MANKIIITLDKLADKDLDNVDYFWQEKILLYLQKLEVVTNPKAEAKKLQGLNKDLYRFRINNYRIIAAIFELDNNVTKIKVLRILHRKDAYKHTNKL